MNRKEFDEFVSETYGISADYPWKDSEEAVYRHISNRKWFAIVLKVKKSKLIPKEKEVNYTENRLHSCAACFFA